MTERTPPAKKDIDRTERIEIFKLLVEMADRVSQRRQAANNFYLSVNTALVGGSAYLKTKGLGTPTFLIVVLAGLMICLLWYQNIQSYKTLNDAKFKVINDIEIRLVEQPFQQEWKVLDPDNDGERHKPFHKVERLVPWVFGAVYAGQALSVVPWSKISWIPC